MSGKRQQGRVKLFLSGGDYANDFTVSPITMEDAIDEIDLQTRMNPDQLAILLVPHGKTKDEIFELLDSLREAVEEGMSEVPKPVIDLFPKRKKKVVEE